MRREIITQKLPEVHDLKKVKKRLATRKALKKVNKAMNDKIKQGLDPFVM